MTTLLATRPAVTGPPATRYQKAQACVAEAIARHVEFIQALKTSKDRAFDCGLALLNAQELLDKNLTFEEFLNDYRGQISRRAAFSYMRFARDLLQWARLKKPRLAHKDQIIHYARNIVLESALGWLALAREAAEVLRPLDGGGRRLGASELERRKFDADYQLELHFSEFESWIGKIPNAKANPFENMEAVKLKALETGTKRVLEMIKEAKATHEI